jgi:hypothetical protein
MMIWIELIQFSIDPERWLIMISSFLLKIGIFYLMMIYATQTTDFVDYFSNSTLSLNTERHKNQTILAPRLKFHHNQKFDTKFFNQKVRKKSEC